MAAAKCIKAGRHGQDVQLLFRPNVRMGKKCDLSDFNCGMIVDARRGGLSISETSDLLEYHARDSLERLKRTMRNPASE